MSIMIGVGLLGIPLEFCRIINRRMSYIVKYDVYEKWSEVMRGRAGC